ncbi:carboxypeptidase regulatory-like domain-containing protein [Streptomyces sp. CA-251387]|uniref:carboxypeptidase regulatory-like domain-containing protein n=1 Tax=Streptomyces sp. CA-251387 TaxID=3240064 RepID=UPI003D8F1460
MSRSWKTTTWGALAVAGVTVMSGTTSGTAYGGEGPAAERAARALRASATIEPGREGRVEVGGYEGAALAAGSKLTLTAPARARVTGTPFTMSGYRGEVARGGGSGTYTFTGTSAAAGDESAAAAWKSRTFPFVLWVRPDAEPGTRLPDCTLTLRDAKGTVRAKGACAVTVGLPAPTLSRPQSGVPLSASPQTAGTAYPGAQVTVRDAAENEVCTTTAAPDGIWSCVPALALRPGPGRLQATATMNGVSATSEQINITVAGTAEGQRDTVSDSEGRRF